MNLRPGVTLSHYRLLEEIGSGGMGVVFKAYDTRLEREVAVKVLRPGSLDDPKAQRRFRQEALALSRLNHPHVQIVFEADRVDGMDFLVTEYIPGAVLHSLTAGGPLPEQRAAELGLQIAEALGAAHDRGVVHRDLSGNNVLVTDGSRIKIVDFGLAMVNKPVTDTQTTEAVADKVGAAGTLPYMSPEQLTGNADPRSDIYAEGVLLYELTTGHLPFENLPPAALVAAIQTSPPPPPRSHNNRLSLRTEDVILKCLEKDPGRRYQSAKELAVDLRRVIDPWPVAHIRRHRLAGSVIAAGVVTVGTLVALHLTGKLGGRSGEPFQNPRMSAVVSWPGEETAALISPDRQWIAFLSDRSGRPGLWRRHVSGGDPEEIVTDTGNILSYAWSPSGTEIVYLHFMEGIPSLRWVSPFGGPPLRTLALDPFFANATIVRWIGSHLYLARDDEGLWRLDNESGALEKLQDASSPEGARTQFDVSPDETRVAFVVPLPKGPAIRTANLDGSRTTRVTEAGVSESNPRWAGRDGRYLMVVSDRGGQPDIWCRDLHRRTARQITFSSSEEMLDDVSLDGTLLVFSEIYATGNLRIRGTSGPRPVHTPLTLDSGMDMWPSVSGPTVAFQRADSGPGMFQDPYDSDIYLIRSDGPEPGTAKLVGRKGGLPVLCPRGRSMAFVRTSKSRVTWELWLHDLVRDTEYRLAGDFHAPGFYQKPLAVSSRNLAWSPDGTVLYYIASGHGLAIHAVTLAGDSFPIRSIFEAEPGSSLGDLTPSPDGSRVAFVRTGPAGKPPSEAFVLDVASGRGRTLYSLPDGTGEQLNLVGWLPAGDRLLALRSRMNPDWTQDVEAVEIDPSGIVTRGRIDRAYACTARLDSTGRTLYLINIGENHPVFNVSSLDLSTGRVSRITENHSPSGSIAGMEVFDGGTILYSQVEQDQGIWMIQFDQ